MQMNIRCITFAVVVFGLMLGGCSGPRQWQVLIASNPAGAIIKIEGAEVGHTPVSMVFEKDTTISIEQRGYESQEVVITSRTGPNLVVNLVQIEMPDAEAVGYTTIEQIRVAYDAGDISKSRYEQYKAEIRARRTIEVERAKRELRDGRLSEEKYKERVRAIKEKYEG